MAEERNSSLFNPRQRLFMRFDDLYLLHGERESQKIGKLGKVASRAYWGDKDFPDILHCPVELVRTGSITV